MTTYKIVQTDRTLPDNVVTTLHWTATLVDGDYTASSYGAIGLEAKDPADPTFVDFADITEAKAIEWLKAQMGAEQVTALEASLAERIEAQKNPTSASGLPWTN